MAEINREAPIRSPRVTYQVLGAQSSKNQGSSNMQQILEGLEADEELGPIFQVRPWRKGDGWMECQ